jgi:hypothetical protein
MINIVNDFVSTFAQTVTDVLPIAIIIFGFQFLVIRKKIAHLKRVLVGFFYVILGLSFFLMGLQEALFPLGRLMADQLTDPAFIMSATHHASEQIALHWTEYYWVYLFAFAIGFSTTIAEPSLLAVAIKAQDVSGGAIGIWGLRISVALGVAVGISLGSYRIVTGLPIHWFIIAGYITVMIQTIFAPKLIIPLAYDSGGVTTSTVTVPLVAALGLGLASKVPGRSELIDGFGLIAFASLFPIISVLAYAQISDFIAKRELKRKQQAQTDSKNNELVEESECNSN